MGKSKKRNAKLHNDRKRGARKVRHKTIKKQQGRKEIGQNLLNQMRDMFLPQVSFWRCQVANYLHSDYKAGVWEPIYAGLYEENTPALTKDEACSVYALKYKGSPIQDITSEAKNVSHWLSMNENFIFESFANAYSKLGEAVYEPKNPTLWAYLNDLYGFEDRVIEGDVVEVLPDDDSEALDEEQERESEGEAPLNEENTSNEARGSELSSTEGSNGEAQVVTANKEVSEAEPTQD